MALSRFLELPHDPQIISRSMKRISRNIWVVGCDVIDGLARIKPSLHSIDTKLRACDERMFWPSFVFYILFDRHDPTLS
jgi:hypothetical protein